MDVPRSVTPKLFVHISEHPDNLYLHLSNKQWVFSALDICENDTFMLEESSEPRTDGIRKALSIEAAGSILIVRSTSSGILDLISALKSSYGFEQVNTPLEEICGNDGKDNCDD